jgi:hypothetical protein
LSLEVNSQILRNSYISIDTVCQIYFFKHKFGSFSWQLISSSLLVFPTLRIEDVILPIIYFLLTSGVHLSLEYVFPCEFIK